jgi:hypothetical protein
VTSVAAFSTILAPQKIGHHLHIAIAQQTCSKCFYCVLRNIHTYMYVGKNYAQFCIPLQIYTQFSSFAQPLIKWLPLFLNCYVRASIYEAKER